MDPSSGVATPSSSIHDPPVRIHFLSTWRAHCGIATYTAALARACRAQGHEVLVLAEAGPIALADFADLPYEHLWDRNDPPSLRRVYDFLAAHRPEVLHVQHEFGPFPWTSDLLTLIDRAKALGIRVVLTPHTIPPVPRVEEVRRLAAASHVTIAHTLRMLDALGTPPVGVRYVHVPHGTAVARRRRKVEARAELGIDPTAFVVASIGFLSQNKNLEHTGLAILRATPRLAGRLLWICGGAAVNPAYAAEFRTWIDTRAAIKARTRLLAEFLDDAALATILGAADLYVAGSRPTFASSSGQVRMAMAHGLPILAADVPLHDDVRSVGRIYPHDCADLHDRIVALAKSPSDRRTLAQWALRRARETAWPIVAARHVECYRGAAAEPQPTDADAADATIAEEIHEVEERRAAGLVAPPPRPPSASVADQPTDITQTR